MANSYCGWPQVRECSATAADPVSTTARPAQGGENHCSGQADGTLVTFGSCSRDYCECLSYKLVLRQCAGDEVFNPASRACIHIGQVLNALLS